MAKIMTKLETKACIADFRRMLAVSPVKCLWCPNDATYCSLEVIVGFPPVPICSACFQRYSDPC